MHYCVLSPIFLWKVKLNLVYLSFKINFSVNIKYHILVYHITVFII